MWEGSGDEAFLEVVLRALCMCVCGNILDEGRSGKRCEAIRPGGGRGVDGGGATTKHGEAAESRSTGLASNNVSLLKGDVCSKGEKEGGREGRRGRWKREKGKGREGWRRPSLPHLH